MVTVRIGEQQRSDWDEGALLVGDVGRFIALALFLTSAALCTRSKRGRSWMMHRLTNSLRECVSCLCKHREHGRSSTKCLFIEWVCVCKAAGWWHLLQFCRRQERWWVHKYLLSTVEPLELGLGVSNLDLFSAFILISSSLNCFSVANLN